MAVCEGPFGLGPSASRSSMLHPGALPYARPGVHYSGLVPVESVLAGEQGFLEMGLSGVDL